MKQKNNPNALLYFDILSKISHELSIAMSLETAFSIILNHLTTLDEIDAGAFFYLKPERILVLEKQINFSESYAKAKHHYEPYSAEVDLLLGGKTQKFEFPLVNDFFQLQKHQISASWLIVSPTRLNGDIVGGLIFIGKKTIQNPDLLLKAIENLSYKIGGVIGRIESEKYLSEHQKSFEKLLQSFHNIIIYNK